MLERIVTSEHDGRYAIIRFRAVIGSVGIGESGIRSLRRGCHLATDLIVVHDQVCSLAGRTGWEGTEKYAAAVEGDETGRYRERNAIRDESAVLLAVSVVEEGHFSLGYCWRRENGEEEERGEE